MYYIFSYTKHTLQAKGKTMGHFFIKILKVKSVLHQFSINLNEKYNRITPSRFNVIGIGKFKVATKTQFLLKKSNIFYDVIFRNFLNIFFVSWTYSVKDSPPSLARVYITCIYTPPPSLARVYITYI